MRLKVMLTEGRKATETDFTGAEAGAGATLSGGLRAH
jgi:hypothetical protein